MARPLRITFPGAFYHITSRGNERKDVFKSRRDREKFLEYLDSATERYDARIHAFCLMNNHYHLLLETPSGNLPQIMRHINGAYTTYFNVKRNRAGHLFQGRYKAILVEKDEYAKELSRYIHLNPVRAKMVKTPEEYAWSSYNFYIGETKPPDWLHRGFILGLFASKMNRAQKGYRKFVSSLIGREYDSPLKEVIGSVLLGTDEYIEFVRDRHLRGKKPSRDLPAIGQIGSMISMEKVIETIESSIGGDAGISKSVSIYLCRKHTGEKLKTIGNRFGISDSAVSQACKRFKTRIQNDRKLKKKVEAVDNKLKTLKVEI